MTYQTCDTMANKTFWNVNLAMSLHCLKNLSVIPSDWEHKYKLSSLLGTARKHPPGCSSSLQIPGFLYTDDLQFPFEPSSWLQWRHPPLKWPSLSPQFHSAPETSLQVAFLQEPPRNFPHLPSLSRLIRPSSGFCFCFFTTSTPVKPITAPPPPELSQLTTVL